MAREWYEGQFNEWVRFGTMWIKVSALLWRSCADVPFGRAEGPLGRVDGMWGIHTAVGAPAQPHPLAVSLAGWAGEGGESSERYVKSA
jgi:hypothetical protein